MKRAWAFGLVLIFFSNALGLFIYSAGVNREAVYFAWSVVLLAASLWWARNRAHLTWADIGLGREGWRHSAAIGAICGLVLAIPLLLFLSFPAVLAGPVRYGEIQNLDALGLLWRIGVELTIATALTEEILFRGILQSLFNRSLSTTGALVATNLFFSFWHLWANFLSIQQNTIVLPFLPANVTQVPGYFGSLIAVGIGGFLLSILRERTHHLAGSIVTHWAAVAAITMLLYLQ